MSFGPVTKFVGVQTIGLGHGSRHRSLFFRQQPGAAVSLVYFTKVNEFGCVHCVWSRIRSIIKGCVGEALWLDCGWIFACFLGMEGCHVPKFSS